MASSSARFLAFSSAAESLAALSTLQASISGSVPLALASEPSPATTAPVDSSSEGAIAKASTSRVGTRFAAAAACETERPSLEASRAKAARASRGACGAGVEDAR